MQTHRFTRVVLSIALFSACAESPASPAPDATAQPVPLDPVGTYELRSSFAVSAPPPAASDMLAELASATDGPDDPSRYLIDRLVARLPDGWAKIAAAAVAPYLAAYAQRRLDSFAPELMSGVRALADGMNRVARQFGTTATLAIGGDGRARHTLTGLRFDNVDVAFAPLGLSDIAMHATVTLDADRLAFGEHAADLPYAAVLRLGFDRAVIPRVVPGATDLDGALHVLVACDRLGGVVADYLGVGSPELYGGACELALTRLAAELYERLAVPGARLTIAGSARAVDGNGDGPIDAISGGTWTGRLDDAPLVSSDFEARRTP